MMVLQLAIWGAWLPLIFGYLKEALGFDAIQQAIILNAFPASAIIGMFFSNQFADRNFAAERFLGVSHLISGIAVLLLSQVTGFWPFCLLMWVHCLLYVPTLSISNSIAFAHLQDPQREFGRVRMGGTVGWILASWPFVFILVDWNNVHAANPHGVIEWFRAVFSSSLKGHEFQAGVRYTYVVSGIASLALAAYSLLLPHTPAKAARNEGEKLAWLEALRFLQHPYILVLWIVALIDAFVHNCFFNYAGRFFQSPAVAIPGIWVMPVMSIGQVAEMLTMFILGSTLKALGWRTTMIIGVLGHVVRFAVFAFLPEHQWLIVFVNLLHGICYAFFFATIYIFVDAYFPKNARASAQGLFNVVILGLGAIIANSICPKLFELFTHDGVTNFTGLFLIPCVAGLIGMAMLALLFHPPKKETLPVEGEILAPAH